MLFDDPLELENYVMKSKDKYVTYQHVHSVTHNAILALGILTNHVVVLNSY